MASNELGYYPGYYLGYYPTLVIFFIVMIDVCSCSIDVWEGIKSYVQAIVKKIHRDIGIGDETVHVSIIQVTLRRRVLVF